MRSQGGTKNGPRFGSRSAGVWSAALLLAVLASVAAPAGARSDGGDGWIAVHDPAELARAVERQARGRPVVLEFYADWCHSCRAMRDQVLTDPRIGRALAGRFLAVRVDVTAWAAGGQDLTARFGVPGLPALRFLDSAGAEDAELRVDGPVDAPSFQALLDRAAARL